MNRATIEKVFFQSNSEKIFIYWNNICIGNQKKDLSYKFSKFLDRKEMLLTYTSFFGVFVSLTSEIFLKKGNVQKNEMKYRLAFIISHISLCFQKNWNLELLQNLDDLISYINPIPSSLKIFLLEENVSMFSTLFLIPFLSTIAMDFKSLQVKIALLKVNNKILENSNPESMAKIFDKAIKISFFLDFGKYLCSLFVEKNFRNITSRENLSKLFHRSIVLTKAKYFNKEKFTIKKRIVKCIFLKIFPCEQKFNFSHFIYIKRKNKKNL